MTDWQSVSVLIAGCGSIGRRHGRVLAGLGVRDLRACDPNPAQRAAFQDEVPHATLFDSYEAGLAGGPQGILSVAMSPVSNMRVGQEVVANRHFMSSGARPQPGGVEGRLPKMPQPDAVLICTPTWMHLPMAEQALRAGCHVLIEKPLSQSPHGVDALAALAAERRKKVMVALCFRYHEGLLRAREILRSGCVGRLVSIRALVGEHLPAVRPDYRDLFSSRYAGAFDLIHEVDLALWFAGLPVRRVLGINGAYSDIGIEAPDLAELLVEFDGNCVASIHLDFFQLPRRRQIELMCTKGTIIVEFAAWDRCTVSVYRQPSPGDATRRNGWEHEEMATQRDDMFRAEDREFLEAIANEKPIACTIEEGLKSVEVVAQAYTFPEPPGGMP